MLLCHSYLKRHSEEKVKDSTQDNEASHLTAWVSPKQPSTLLFPDPTAALLGGQQGYGYRILRSGMGKTNVLSATDQTSWPGFLYIFFSFFADTGGGTQGLTLAKQALYH